MTEVDVERQGSLMTITINRPAARNAIALTTMEQLEQAWIGSRRRKCRS